MKVDDKTVSIVAYNIEGNSYFKLRDLTMALNGTEKQFVVFWQAGDDYKEVDLLSGKAYTPVGGELSAPSHVGNSVARLATTRFGSVGGWAAIHAYTVDGAHYVRLSDLAGTLKFAATCDEEKRTAEIDTSPQIVLAGVTGEAFDNIALTHAGNSWTVDEDGNVIISYNRGKTTIKTPVTVDKDEMEYAGDKTYPGVFISEEKTAMAYGGTSGDPIYMIYSDDMGKTWTRLDIISNNVGVGQLYISFITQNDGWLVLGNFHGMGYENNFIYRTVNGGKTWTQIGNPNDLYARVLTGAGFSNDKIGFLCFRYDFIDFKPAICRTQDGGQTWEKLYITLPKKYADYKKTPLSPVFYGTNGLFPIQLSNSEGTVETIYLKSDDYGKTWTAGILILGCVLLTMMSKN